MKKVKSLQPNKMVLFEFDKVISKLNVNRTAALSNIMNWFNVSILTDKDVLRKLATANPEKEKYGKEIIRFSVNVESEIIEQFLENTKTMTVYGAVTNLMYLFIQLPEKEQFNIIYGA